jgi:folate-dependent phosphoribosylglycinamide formyltransferase PurN
MRRPWVVFFSRTGTEIYKLCEKLGIYPDGVISNKKSHTTTNANLIMLSTFRSHKLNNSLLWHQIPNNPSVEDYESVLKNYKNPIVTLHGYLRIIPREICSKYEIYNLHPGNIKLYPSLKGKDPQKQAFFLRHTTVGCVLHRVIPEVDEGEIIYSQSIYNDCETLDCVYEKCANIALDLWQSFFRSYVKLEPQ